MEHLTTIIHAVAALLAWALYRRDGAARQRSLAFALTLLLALDVTRRLAAPTDLQARIAAWQAGHPPPPYEGVDRWAWALGQTATRAWYAVSAWMVWRALKQESPERSQLQGLSTVRSWRFARIILPVLAFLASLFLYFALYPLLRGRPSQNVAVVTYVLALAVELLAVTLATLRGHWPAREDFAAWLSSLVLVCSTCAGLAGSWALAKPGRDWYISPWIGVPTWLVVTGVHLWILIFRRTASR